jgi:phosphoribosyl 1,2-cyclic phosphodiesterase
LASIGVAIEDIDGILISHEHIDHIRGAKILAKRHNIPVLANADTARAMVRTLGENFPMKIFSTGETFELEDVKVHPFTVQHDAVDPVMFTLTTPDYKVGICTDLGFATSLVRAQLQNCDYLLLESNHEPSMVHACPRPMSYKQRVLSRSGHLSNQACGELIRDIYHDGLKHVYLGHLSSECNSTEACYETVRSVLNREGLSVAISVAELKTVSKPTLFPQISVPISAQQ